MSKLTEALHAELERTIKSEDLDKVYRLLEGLLYEEWVYAQLLWTSPMEETKRLDLVGFGPHHQASIRLNLGRFRPGGRPLEDEPRGGLSRFDFSRVDTTPVPRHEAPSSGTGQPVTLAAVIHRPDRSSINLGGRDKSQEGMSFVTFGSLPDLLRAWLGYPLPDAPTADTEVAACREP